MDNTQGQLREHQSLRGQLRCYHFGNMYLSSIQQGIQAAHAQMEMFVKYNPHNVEFDLDKCDKQYTNALKMLYKWATYHKTMICLNAGMDTEMRAIEAFLECGDNPYPWAAFRESEEAMGGMLTNIAIILPEEVYGVSTGTLEIAAQQNMGSPATMNLSDFDKDLIKMKNQYRMAR